MIELTNYTHQWQEAFEALKTVILAAIKDIQVEHIGSTAIHGVKAKNIIDVQLGVESFEKISALQSTLIDLGFEHIENIKQDHVPFHEFDYFEDGWQKHFFKGQYYNQLYNIHVRIIDNPNWKFALDFRNYLNSNTNARYAFMQFKERLANSNISIEDYCKIKDSVIDLLSLQF
jgi:dephospho-CoA kinase